ncbi:phage tail protein [Mesorhizobium sp. 128a]
MAWFSTPGLGTGGSWSFAPRPTSAVQPDPVSASSPFNVGKVLGRPIPIVIGTYPVDGMPVVGGALTVSTISGYNQVTLKNYEGLSDYPPGSKWLNNDPFSRVALVPIPGSQQVAALGYLLAFDPFGDGYELIQLSIDNEVVFDAENGIGASETFRFYGGNHTAVDPIAKGVIGSKAGAWRHFAMVYIDGRPSTSAPSVKAVISNAASSSRGNEEIAWITDDVSSLASDGATGGTLGAAYDIADGIIYQTLTASQVPGLTQVYLVALDVDTHVEIYRVPLAGSEEYVTGVANTLAIRGSGFVLVRMAVPSEADSPTRIYNATTGAIVAEWREATGETLDWRVGMQFGAKYVFVGVSYNGSNWVDSFYAIADLSLGTLLVSSDPSFDIGVVVRGRTLAGSISFFVNGSAIGEVGNVYELTFDGDTWTRTLAYDAAGDVYGIAFDPKTGYLVASVDEGGGTHRIAYVDPETATLVDSFTGPQSYTGDGGLNAEGYERFWAKPGFALFQKMGTNQVYLLNIEAKSFSLYATIPEATTGYVRTGIYDQGRQAWFYGRNDDVWTEHRLPNTIPGAMALEDILTKAAFLGRYTPEQLTFDGDFVGRKGYGVGILTNSNIRTVIQSIADIFGFKFADTGDGMYFKLPDRDDAFTLDAVLTTADLVYGETSAVESQDEAEIRQVSRVELQYISKDQGYTQRPASFSMPSITNAIRVEQFSSPLVLTDEDAQTFVTEKYFELQASQRTHAFSITGESRFLPGDVVSVPSGTITYSVQIDSVALNPSDMSVDIAATDFQTAFSTTITPVTNTGFGSVIAVSLATQYIHLDVPLFRYADDLGGTGLRQYGVLIGRGQAGWTGGTLFRGNTPSEQSALFDQAPHGAVIGICTDALGNPVDPFATTDASTVTFRKTAGDASLLVDKTEAQVLAGANFAYIGAPGRWEGIGYKTVTDNGNGTFTLSGLTIRGYRGTEVFAGLHQAGDIFLMIDPAWLKSAVHPLSDLDATRYYKAVGIGQDPATGVVLPRTIIGAAETPYASINLDAVAGTPDGIDLSWDYRSRLAAGTNPANFGEATLAFEIDIYATDGVTYKRTLTATTNSVHYASADVVADLGSDPPTELFFRVYMMSALDILVPGQDRPVYGRGYEARHHVYFSGFGEPLGLLLTLTKA